MSEPTAKKTWPGVEGLRGIALFAVFMYHQDARWLPGGYLSVSLFFTLSGFLITRLIIGERVRTGTIDLPRFWARRVRRLLPVAMIGLALATGVAWATRATAQLPAIADDLRYAALNLANWRSIRVDTTYAAALASESPVTHYWTLAIEEQYYLVYPALAALALRWRRIGLATLLIAMTAGSFAAQLLVGGGDRAYFGTDTRLAELAIGGLAAVVWTGRTRERLLPHLDVLGALGGVALAAAWWKLDLASPKLFHGALLVHAGAACLLIVGAAEGRLVPRLAGLRPLVWLGGVSYAAYVVHLPLFVLLDADRVGLSGIPLFVLRVGVTLVVAWGVSVLVERPVRFTAPFPRWQAPVAAVSTLGIVLVLAAALPRLDSKDGLDTTFASDAPKLVLGAVPEVDELPPPTGPDGGPTVTTIAGPSATSVPGQSGPPPAKEPTRALKLLMAGDSTAGVWGVGMQEWGAQGHAVAVDLTGRPGCVLYQDGVAMLRTGWIYTPTGDCHDVVDIIVDAARTTKPDAIVLMIGSIQLADWVAGKGVLPAAFGVPAFDAGYRRAFDSALDRLSTELSVPILVATIPGPRWAPAGAPGVGPLTMNDVARSRRMNEINAEVVAEHPRARMVPFGEAVSDSSGSVDPALHPDGLHIDPDLVGAEMDAGLEVKMDAAYTSVIASDPSIRVAGTTIWHR